MSATRVLVLGSLACSPAADEQAREDLRSAERASSALRRAGYDVLTRAITLDACEDAPLPAADLAVLCVHGALGGTGALHRTLEQHEIPVAGPSAAVTARAFDKLLARRTLARHGLPVPFTVPLLPDFEPDAESLDRLGWPCVVKPRRGALGAGVQRICDPAQVTAAIDRALLHDEHLLLERDLPGVEVQVVLVDGVPLGSAQVCRATPNQTTSMTLPPMLSEVRLAGVQRLAARAAEVLGLTRGLCRVDLLVDDRWNETILEVEPSPPLHDDSAVARVSLAAGVALDAVILRSAGLLEDDAWARLVSPDHDATARTPAQVAGVTTERAARRIDDTHAAP